MTEKNSPTYLFKSSQGVYYFRIRIPQLIRNLYRSDRKEVRISLRTKNRLLALKKSKRVFVMVEKSNYTLENMEESPKDKYGKSLLKQFLIAKIESRNKSLLVDDDEQSLLDQFIFNLSDEEKEILCKSLDWWSSLSPESRMNEEKLLKKSIYSDEMYDENINTNGNVKTNFVKDLIDEFMISLYERREREGRKYPKSTKDEYRSIFDDFINIIGSHIEISEINRNIIKNYAKTIFDLPKNHTRNKIYKDKTISEILSLKINNSDKKSAATINKNYMRVKQFLDWAKNEGYIDQDLSSNLVYLKDNKKANEKKDKFNDVEIGLLFNNDTYINGIYSFPSRYWIPLIAIYTGARGEEIAQLYSDDIVKDENTQLYYFNIVRNAQRRQFLKNDSAERVIPVHKNLISLGFIEFALSKKKGVLLFPELDVADGRRFKKFGNNFNRKTRSGWMVKCGVTRNTLSFHSFRHNVVDFLSKNSVRETVSCSLVGHSYKGQGLVKNYIKNESIEELSKAINSINYKSIDLRKFKKIRWS